jgi:CubicO group peptidase (beta-lactamase class C family)
MNETVSSSSPLPTLVAAAAERADMLPRIIRGQYPQPAHAGPERRRSSSVAQERRRAVDRRYFYGVAMQWAVMLALGTALFPVGGAGAAPPAICGAPAAMSDGWQVTEPEKEGLDAELICAIGPGLEKIKEADPNGVVVIRHGVLVYEHYFTGTDERLHEPLGRVPHEADTLHDLRSITKSVTALLVGIAIDRSWFDNLDAPVFSFFPQHDDLRTPEKDRVTLRHLLTMTSGLTWPEGAVSYYDASNVLRKMEAASDPSRFFLEQPLDAAPGTVWNYNSGGVDLLGVILQEASGRLLDQLAKEELFDPLEITDWQFEAASWGLRLRPRDMAKIGQLVLNHGVWQGRRIVSATWVQQMIAPQAPSTWLLGSARPYGYLWWLGRSFVRNRGIDWVGGIGNGGQRLYVVPTLDLVVAVTAGVYKSSAPDQNLAGDTVLNEFVLPAALGH